jgi:hypothetical protein
MRVFPAAPVSAYTGYGLSLFHFPPSPTLQYASFAKGGSALLLSVMKNRKACVCTSRAAAKYESVHVGLIHGARAISAYRPFCGKFEGLVALVGTYGRLALRHGSSWARSGVYNRPVTSFPLLAPFVLRVRMFCCWL